MLTSVNRSRYIVFVFTFGSMKPVTYRIVLLFITLTIIATIVLQVRWNVKNYDENKLRTLNEIQIAFDNGVENYYARQIKKELVVILSDSVNVSKYKEIQRLDSTMFKMREKKIDTVRIFRRRSKFPDAKDFPKVALDEHKKIAVKKMENFNEMFMTAFYQDSINFEKLDSLFVVELNRKKIDLVYDFHFKKRSTKPYSGIVALVLRQFFKILFHFSQSFGFGFHKAWPADIRTQGNIGLPIGKLKIAGVGGTYFYKVILITGLGTSRRKPYRHMHK